MDAPARLRTKPSWLLSQAALAGDRLVSEALAAEGVRKYHFRVLIALADDGPLSQADLGRRLGIDRSDMAPSSPSSNISATSAAGATSATAAATSSRSRPRAVTRSRA